jgi:hypothetical protein
MPAARRVAALARLAHTIVSDDSSNGTDNAAYLYETFTKNAWVRYNGSPAHSVGQEGSLCAILKVTVLEPLS